MKLPFTFNAAVLRASLSAFNVLQSCAAGAAGRRQCELAIIPITSLQDTDK